ncbi:hypothetical protein ACFYYL_01990 [Actinomadura geliboluensis]|uniref:hypothetical protein n=1 Tax=Actinomadura geliboluensis TaxID=882440 RepID=UPI0036B6EA22
MEHRRHAERVPAPGLPGDTRVAGPAPEPPVADAPEPVPDTAPDPMPAVKPEPAADTGPTADTGPLAAPGPVAAPDGLFDPAETERFRERWREVQSAFVDDPGAAVRRADELAAEAAEALLRAIAAHRRALSDGLDGGGQADTERLRLALRGYRDLLDRVCAS